MSILDFTDLWIVFFFFPLIYNLIWSMFESRASVMLIVSSKRPYIVSEPTLCSKMINSMDYNQLYKNKVTTQAEWNLYLFLCYMFFLKFWLRLQRNVDYCTFYLLCLFHLFTHSCQYNGFYWTVIQVRGFASYKTSFNPPFFYIRKCLYQLKNMTVIHSCDVFELLILLFD